MKLWIRNDLPESVGKNEFIGPLRQSTFIDPFSKSGIIHKGYSIEEEESMGKIGIYIEIPSCKN